MDTPPLRGFVDDVFESLQRVDQRRWAQAYLEALLSVVGKKTLRRLAKAVSPTPAAARGLQQFINASPWDWTPVRRRLAHAVAEERTPHAWTLAVLTIPKRGKQSVGVDRRFDAETGRVINCQQAIGLFLSTDTNCIPVDWTLLLGDSWCKNEQRRRRARIPETVSTRPAWAHILDLASAVAVQPWLASVPWSLDLRRISESGVVMEGLARRGLDFVCEVSAEQPVMSAQTPSPVLAVKELMARGQTRQCHLVHHAAKDGRAKPFTVHCESVRLLPRTGDSSVSPYVHRCLSPLPTNVRQNARFWITNFPDQRAEEILTLARCAPAAECAVVDLATDFGVQDFEGRSFPGWHHHITMASAAYTFRHLRVQGTALCKPLGPQQVT
jgi:hypothetical protein